MSQHDPFYDKGTQFREVFASRKMIETLKIVAIMAGRNPKVMDRLDVNKMQIEQKIILQKELKKLLAVFQKYEKNQNSSLKPGVIGVFKSIAEYVFEVAFRDDSYRWEVSKNCEDCDKHVDVRHHFFTKENVDFIFVKCLTCNSKLETISNNILRKISLGSNFFAIFDQKKCDEYFKKNEPLLAKIWTFQSPLNKNIYADFLMMNENERKESFVFWLQINAQIEENRSRPRQDEKRRIRKEKNMENTSLENLVKTVAEALKNVDEAVKVAKLKLEELAKFVGATKAETHVDEQNDAKACDDNN